MANLCFELYTYYLTPTIDTIAEADSDSTPACMCAIAASHPKKVPLMMAFTMTMNGTWRE